MSADSSRPWHPPTTVQPSQLHAPLPPGYTYTDSTPTFTKQTPGKLLDKYYFHKRNEPDWTDPNGVLSKQMEVYLKYPDYAVAPIGSPGLVGKWPRPNDLPAEPVPVYDVPIRGIQFVVEFRNLDPACPSAGVPLEDLYGDRMDSLQDARDIVFNGFGVRDISFVIAWPGYERRESVISTVAGDGGPLTRFDLGRKITTMYCCLFWRVETERLLPEEVGFYNIALHQGLRARSDSLGVQLAQLHLVRLRGTIGGNWVADIDIV